MLEMEVGLPTDNREKKGKGIGIWGIEAAQSRSGGKKQEEQDSCYENQAVKSLTGLSLRNCPAVRVSSGSTLTVLMTTSQILAGAPLV